MRPQSIYTLAFILFFSCSESGSEDPTPTNINISGIEISHSPVVNGQVVKLEAKTDDILNNPEYTWTAKYEGQEVGLITINGSKSSLFVNKGIGEYQVEVKIKDGEKQGSIQKIVSVGIPDFEFGAWGNSKEVISESESEHGNSIYPNLIGMPEPYAGAVNDRLVYQRSSTKFIAYYFGDSKLKGGSFYKSGPPRNSNGDFIWYQLYYRSDQNEIDQKYGIKGIEVLNWKVSEERQEQYLTQSNGQGLSMAVDNGHLDIVTTWEKNEVLAVLKLYRFQNSAVISYTVYKK